MFLIAAAAAAVASATNGTCSTVPDFAISSTDLFFYAGEWIFPCCKLPCNYAAAWVRSTGQFTPTSCCSLCMDYGGNKCGAFTVNASGCALKSNTAGLFPMNGSTSGVGPAPPKPLPPSPSPTPPSIPSEYAERLTVYREHPKGDLSMDERDSSSASGALLFLLVDVSRNLISSQFVPHPCLDLGEWDKVLP